LLEFEPLVSHPHLQTILSHFWPDGLDERRFPVDRRYWPTAPEVEVLVESQRPPGAPAGGIVMVHGLEGSSGAGYMRSLAQAALTAGYASHRLNLRSCGGTEHHAKTAYHSGMTCDVLSVLETLHSSGRGPLFLTGFSLGGNVVLKLAGELGEKARGLIAGVCAVAAPIDLSASTRCIEMPQNRVYEKRFLRKLKRRIRSQHRLRPAEFPIDGLDRVRSIREFDGCFTARYFGFRDAEDYYHSQSAIRFLAGIRVPVLLLEAQDDPVVPFEIFTRPEVRHNPHIELIAPEHGGHLGFIARRPPRLWANHALLAWIRRISSPSDGD